MDKECKHGLKAGCAYCHVMIPAPTTSRPATRRRTPGARLSDKMNDRMTNLNKRLRALRQETPGSE
ncbi:MAG TPA: hypothetical protein VGT02_06075 [Methylomirabilota bacterium]|jgi:hypothetical protein|nr:hypothetical protein [Methylomirabilota bacterium]